MSNNLLDDDFDWKQIQDGGEYIETNDGVKHQAVIMLHTFNTEEQAYLAAATLRLEGIDAHIVTAATSQLTPFAYGNVRLFVAKSHEKEARALLKDFNARQQVFEDPIFSSTQILLIIVAGIVAMSLVLYFLRAIFTVVFP